MAATYTQRTKLAKPGPADREWNLPLNANADTLDALAPIGGLCVSTVETPSTSFQLQVAPGRFQRCDGTIGVFNGSTSLTIPAESMSSIHLTDDGTLVVSQSGFPTTSHVPLAVAVSDTTTVTTLTDVRVVCATVGSDSRPFLTPSGGTLVDGASFTVGASSGLKIGTSTTQKLGFWNASPITRPGPYTQDYNATSRQLAAYTPVSITTSFTGIVAGQSGSNYAQATDLNALRTAYENLRIFSENSTQLLNALIQDLKAMGLLG